MQNPIQQTFENIFTSPYEASQKRHLQVVRPLPKIQEPITPAPERRSNTRDLNLSQEMPQNVIQSQLVAAKQTKSRVYLAIVRPFNGFPNRTVVYGFVKQSGGLEQPIVFEDLTTDMTYFIPFENISAIDSLN